MKKIISLTLSLALLLGCMLTLASCGAPKLEGTYSGSYFTDDEDILTITIKKDKTVEYSLLIASEAASLTAKGAYTIEKEEDHGHELIKFTVEAGANALLFMMNNCEYVYSLEKAKGAKTLTLAGHDNDYFDLTLTEVKK